MSLTPKVHTSSSFEFTTEWGKGGSAQLINNAEQGLSMHPDNPMPCALCLCQGGRQRNTGLEHAWKPPMFLMHPICLVSGKTGGRRSPEPRCQRTSMCVCWPLKGLPNLHLCISPSIDTVLGKYCHVNVSMSGKKPGPTFAQQGLLPCTESICGLPAPHHQPAPARAHHHVNRHSMSASFVCIQETKLVHM